MLSETQIYRLPLYMRIMTFLGIILFGFASIASYFDNEQVVSFSCFVPFSLFSLFAFISSLYKVELSDEKISVTNYLRTKTLRWHEIAKITPKSDGFGFYLSDQNVDVRIFISSQIVNFLELVESIKQKTPDLWRREIPRTFHQVLRSVLILVAFGGGIALYSIFGLVANANDLWAKIILLVFGLLILGISLSNPREITFEGNNLIMRYYGWEKSIQVNDVKEIYVEHKMSENLSMYPVQVKLKTEKQ